MEYIGQYDTNPECKHRVKGSTQYPLITLPSLKLNFHMSYVGYRTCKLFPQAGKRIQSGPVRFSDSTSHRRKHADTLFEGLQ